MDPVEAAIADIPGVRLAAHNGPGQAVVSGESAAVDQAVERITAAGAKRVVELKTSGAWHSDLMEPAKAELAAALNDVQPAHWRTLS